MVGSVKVEHGYISIKIFEGWNAIQKVDNVLDVDDFCFQFAKFGLSKTIIKPYKCSWIGHARVKSNRLSDTGRMSTSINL